MSSRSKNLRRFLNTLWCFYSHQKFISNEQGLYLIPPNSLVLHVTMWVKWWYKKPFCVRKLHFLLEKAYIKRLGFLFLSYFRHQGGPSFESFIKMHNGSENFKKFWAPKNSWNFNKIKDFLLHFAKVLWFHELFNFFVCTF